MIKKCTIKFSPSILRFHKESRDWTESAGIQKAVRFPSYLMSALLRQSIDKSVREADIKEWGVALEKCFNVGHAENDDLVEALHRGVRATAFIFTDEIEMGIGVAVTFFGKGEGNQWKIEAGFSYFEGTPTGLTQGGNFPSYWPE